MPPRAVAKSVRKTGGLFDGVKSNVDALVLGVKYFIDPKRMTMFYPKEYLERRPGYRGFIVLKKDVCISCAACARVCPAAAMKMVKVSEPDPKEPTKLKQKQYPVINYQRCIFCGYCVDVCPVEALYHLPYHDITYQSLGDMFLTLESFQREPGRPVEGEGAPVVYEVDEKLGLVKRERRNGR